MNLSGAIGVAAHACKVIMTGAILVLPVSHGNAAGIAGDYPNRSVRVLDQYGAGGATDVMSRMIGQKFSERFGQTILVDNRPGVPGNLAAALAAQATPDG